MEAYFALINAFQLFQLKNRLIKFFTANLDLNLVFYTLNTLFQFRFKILISGNMD